MENSWLSRRITEDGFALVPDAFPDHQVARLLHALGAAKPIAVE